MRNRHFFQLNLCMYFPSQKVSIICLLLEITKGLPISELFRISFQIPYDFPFYLSSITIFRMKSKDKRNNVILSSYFPFKPSFHLQSVMIKICGSFNFAKFLARLIATNTFWLWFHDHWLHYQRSQINWQTLI